MATATSEDGVFPPKTFVTWASNGFSILLKSLPIGSVLAGILFWKYLNSIGRPDLFLPCLSSLSGAVCFLVVFTLMTLLGVHVLVLPSTFIAFLYHSVAKEIGEQAAQSFPRGILCLIPSVILTILLMLFGLKGFSIIFGPLAGVILNFLWLYKCHRGYLTQMFPSKDQAWCRIWQVSGYAGVLWFGGVLTTFPLLLVLPFIGGGPETWWSTLFDLGVLVLITGASLFPALMYCSVAVSNHSWRNPILAFVAGAAALIILFVKVTPSVTDHIMNKAASEIGLRVVVPHNYVIRTDSLDLSLLDKTKWNLIKNAVGISVDALVPLAMGELLLLCPVVNEKDISVEWYRDECFDFKKDEVRRMPRQKVSIDATEKGKDVPD